ncbi:MAG: Omp28-related outer membrane protein [Bacteroidota bacterium]
MKKIHSLALLVVVTLLFSCSDTVVVENRPNQSTDAPAISGYFKKRVLIEDYTGTWCGNCTRVSHAIELVKAQSDKVVTVAIHNGNDPYHFAGIAPLKNLILPNSPLALPVSRLNRVNVWTFPEPTNTQEALNFTSNNTTLGIAMNSTVANGNINLDVNVKFLDTYSDLKLVVYLLEDHLIYFQRNYTTYYNAVNPILDYEHNHVLRNSLTDILGDAITGTTNGSTVTKNFTIPIPSTIENPNNINFVAFVVGADNQVLNARAADSNESQVFEVNP